MTVLRDFILLAALWGASFLFMQLAAAQFGTVATTALRCGIAVLVLLPVILMRGQQAALRTHWKPLAMLGVVSAALPFAFYAYAVQHISTGLTAIINTSAPTFGALVAWLWLGDRPDRFRIAGLGLGFAGVALLVGGQPGLGTGAASGATAWAVLACLGANLCYGIAACAVKRHCAGVPPLAMVLGTQGSAAAALLLPALWVAPVKLPQLSAWLAVAVLGVLCTGLAFLLYYRLIERIGPARTMTVTFLIPVFAVFYGAVFLQETVTPAMLACAGLVVLGTALSSGVLRLVRRSPASG